MGLTVEVEGIERDGYGNDRITLVIREYGGHKMLLNIDVEAKVDKPYTAEQQRYLHVTVSQLGNLRVITDTYKKPERTGSERPEDHHE